MIRRIWMAFAALVLAAVFALSPAFLNASDHDDGETDTKGRNMNITDVYAFRERDQNPSAAADNLILIMNVNPRSVARQQYYFSTTARYEIKVERPTNVNTEPTVGGLTEPDVTLRFTFGAPDTDTRRQPITLTKLVNNAVVSSAVIGNTTALDDPLILNDGGAGVLVFAGLRQDPFFFDVEQFFRVRAGALNFGPPEVFRHPGIDFTWGYNVLSIVVRVPFAFLRQGMSANAFDVWTTICIPTATNCMQVERLAQPAINEGLLVKNESLNFLNSIGPEVEATVVEPEACAAALAVAVIAEAANTLLKFGNTGAQALAICNAFLPDVMRIDVTVPSGYARTTSMNGRPASGRMIKDDVIDITLSVVVPGSNQLLEHDNVGYDANPPINATGHGPLLATFPYLPAPN